MHRFLTLPCFGSLVYVAWQELLLATSDSPPSAIEMDYIAPESLLGIFLRRVIVKVAKLSFSGMVRTFESYQAWCGVEAFPLQAKQRVADADGHALLQTAGKLFDNGFVHEAMDAAHKHFDYSTTLHVVLVDGGLAPTTVVHSNHEAALLYHASMCIQSGQLDQGVMALETTIKLAQQRSKHDVVAVALLWLHHVLARIVVHTILQDVPTRSSPASIAAVPRATVKRAIQSSTGEVVLMRCLGGAASLGLPDIVALGTLAFAKEVVSPCIGLEACGAAASDSSTALTSVRLGWALQAAAELGDVPLTMSFVRSHVGTGAGGEDKTISSKAGSKVSANCALSSVSIAAKSRSVKCELIIALHFRSCLTVAGCPRMADDPAKVDSAATGAVGHKGDLALGSNVCAVLPPDPAQLLSGGARAVRSEGSASWR
jgi:hypothetical protein